MDTEEFKDKLMDYWYDLEGKFNRRRLIISVEEYEYYESFEDYLDSLSTSQAIRLLLLGG